MQEEKIAFYKRPAFIFLSLIPVLLIIFRYLIGFNGLYGQDGFEYFAFSRITFDYFHQAMIPHSFHWPILYPVLGAILSFIFSTDLSLQLISVSAFSGTLFFIHKTIVLLYPSSEGKLGYVLLLGMLSSFLLRLGVCVMSDMLAIFFITGAFFNIIQFEKTRKLKNSFLAILFSSCAFLTREPSAIILVVPILRFIFLLFRGKERSSFVFTVLISIPFLVLIYFCRQLQVNHISEMFNEWSVKNYFLNEYGTPSNGSLHYRFPNLIFVLEFFVHPGYLLLSAVLLFFVRKTDLAEGKFYLFILPILIYLFFLAGFMNQNVRLNTLALPLWIMFLFPAASRFADLLTVKRFSMTLYGMLILVSQSVLFYFAFDDFYFQTKLERGIATYVQEKYPNDTILSFGMGPALRYYGVKKVREALPHFEEDLSNLGPQKTLVLIQTEKFGAQWEGSEYDESWKAVGRIFSPIKIHTFANGWDLYESK